MRLALGQRHHARLGEMTIRVLSAAADHAQALEAAGAARRVWCVEVRDTVRGVVDEGGARRLEAGEPHLGRRGASQLVRHLKEGRLATG